MQKQLRKKRLKKIARVHAAFVVVLFLSYISLSLIYSPEFLLSDLRQKYSAVADSAVAISAKVLGPPVKPILTGSTRCSNLFFSNTIKWPADENAQTFSIYRNGLALATSLTTTEYTDTSADAKNPHTYRVVAHGQMHPEKANSDPITIDPPIDCKTSKSQLIASVALAGSKTLAESNLVKTTSQKPTFSGNSNLPFAIINIEVHSSELVFGQTMANANGYWIWTSPINLSVEQHALLLTVQDPDDSSNTVSSSLLFEINNIGDEDEKANESSNQNDSANKKTLQQPRIRQPLDQNNALIQNNIRQRILKENPIDFSLALKNDSIYQGKDLATTIKINKLDQQSNPSQADIAYKILNQDAEELFSQIDKKTIIENGSISKVINLPKSISEGTYALQIAITSDKFSSSKEILFTVKPVSIINLGAGTSITYSEILSKLGTITIALSTIFLIWIFLFSREYWLYIHAFNNITERHLAKIGSFGARKRKGVHK